VCVVVVVVMLFVVVKENRSVTCFQTNSGLALGLCCGSVCSNSRSKHKQPNITRGWLLGENGAGKIDRELQVPGDTGVLCPLF